MIYINPLTREELFLNCLINSIEPPKPQTREEELFVKLIEKINKSTCVTLYQFTNDGNLYLKNEELDEYKITLDKIKELYQNSPLYFKKYNRNTIEKEGTVKYMYINEESGYNRIYFTIFKHSETTYTSFRF